MADSDTPLLNRVEEPADLRRLTERQLRQFADELRRETIAVVSDTGGHLGAGLGVPSMVAALKFTQKLSF